MGRWVDRETDGQMEGQTVEWAEGWLDGLVVIPELELHSDSQYCSYNLIEVSCLYSYPWMRCLLLLIALTLFHVVFQLLLQDIQGF